MVNLSIEQIRNLMTDPQKIRNFSIISSGLSEDPCMKSLQDSLIARAGVIITRSFRYCERWSEDWDKDLFKYPVNSFLYYESNSQNLGHKNEYLINMIDLLVHKSLQSDITSSLRLADGVVVIVDLSSSLYAQTGAMIREAMNEKVRPVLMVDGIEKNILDSKQDGEMIYQSIVKLLKDIETTTSSFEQSHMGNLSLWPNNGNIIIGSTSQGWGFTLRNFANIYSKMFQVDTATLMDKLWGDNYFDPDTKTWITQNTSESGKILQRGFVQFIMEPIIKLSRHIMEGNEEQIDQVLATIDIKRTTEEKQLKGITFLKTVMSKWINLADCVLEMIVIHLPSPKEAQKYRTSYLYEGPQDDACAQAMRDCDPKGPLMIFISRIIPNAYSSTFYAFGRVFSGTVSAGQKVKIMSPKYSPGKKDDLIFKNVPKIILPVSRYPENWNDLPAGSLVCLSGIAQYILKNATISDCEDACTIRAPKYSVSPIVKAAVQPKEAANLPKVIDGLRKLTKVDGLAQLEVTDTNELLVAGTDDHHLELCLKALEEEYACCEIIKSDLIVTYKETIAGNSRLCLAKSPNKHNRIYCVAEPISADLAHAIESKQLDAYGDTQVLTTNLKNEFDWELEDAKQIWAFGPERDGSNILVNMTQGVQFINEIKDACESAFMWATREGVLCQENVRQFRGNIVDVSLHSDAIHRGGGQIIPTVRRAFFACQLTAQPRIQEPIYLAEITTPLSTLEGVHQCLGERRGVVVEEKPISESHLWLIKSYLPVTESFKFPAYVREKANGCASVHLVFSHWMQLDEDPLDNTSRAYGIVQDIRRRKGMMLGAPELINFMDNV